MEENNQYQEEVKSYPILGEGELWVKLKFPRDDEITKRSDFYENQIIEKDDDDQNQKMKGFSKRVCHICHKSFGSGKALGGHMRIHVQKKKNKFKKQENTFINDGLYFDGDDVMNKEQIICTICRKEFRSMKSLYGHMRCHPDRDWRGINPPSEKLKSSVDLKEYCLKGWQVTAKRGRGGVMVNSKSGFSLNLDDVQAVDYLMMMSRRGTYCGSPKVDEVKMPSEKRVFEGERLDFENAIDDDRKKRKRVNICDLKSARKKVSCHQALGCQKTSSVEVATMNSTGERMMDFDLNELPQSEDDEPGLTLNYLAL
ncbi:hypothetical protein CASFOL_018742 [Castilleja foliolosa]|uniref:C2H2-type domain-containing protein n=1 Tax=Castilleja foliolosa TaxID=1961234 RepID=A0ABD3D6V5_9LAMI